MLGNSDSGEILGTFHFILPECLCFPKVFQKTRITLRIRKGVTFKNVTVEGR